MRKSFYNVRMRRSRADFMRGSPLLKTYEISKFPKDFKISGRFHGISGRFHGGVQSMRKLFYNVRMRRSRANTRFRRFYGILTGDFEDFGISREISRFH